jgi:hypothetical protein
LHFRWRHNLGEEIPLDVQCRLRDLQKQKKRVFAQTLNTSTTLNARYALQQEMRHADRAPAAPSRPVPGTGV